MTRNTVSKIFTTGNQFIEAFKPPDDPEYVELQPLDNEVGFSIQRPYPQTSRFKPPLKRDNSPDSVALIGVVYKPRESTPQRPTLVPIRARVSVYSRYIARHWDYDFEDEDCPTRESVAASKRTPRPVDLYTSEQYYYDHDKDQLVDSKGDVVIGREIIETLYSRHLATVDKFRGLIFRFKLRSITKTSDICVPLASCFERALRVFCGRTLEPKTISKRLSGGYGPEDMKLLQTESIDFFGYKASKNVIGTYCAILLFMFAIFKIHGATPQWIKVLADNNLLSLATSILALAALDHVVPAILLRLVNLMHKARWTILLIPVRFKSPEG